MKKFFKALMNAIRGLLVFIGVMVVMTIASTCFVISLIYMLVASPIGALIFLIRDGDDLADTYCNIWKEYFLGVKSYLNLYF